MSENQSDHESLEEALAQVKEWTTQANQLRVLWNKAENRIRELEMQLDEYRQMATTLLGIVDELDTANGWIIVRDSIRAKLEGGK